MKTQIFKISLAGLAAASLPFLNGCEAQSSEAAKNSNNLPASNGVVVDAPPAPAGELTAKPEAAPAAAVQKSLPPNLNPASPSAEIVKLAQAGVEEGVMMSFITNSTKSFGLGSDEIIYLNDLGVPGSVVTTMIEHDKALKQYWANAAQVPAPAAEISPDASASAPSYVNPPVVAAAEPQPTVVNNNYFYDTLSPYGTWVDIDGYGRCWQPTVVVGNRNWQPYSDRGRWVYSDAGWYWLSDYSWGATAFHYGRWFNHARWGWCWWPDNVWGPSWVTWRSGGDYCGWAALPPHSYYRPGFGFSYRGSSVGFSFDFGIGVSCFTFVPTARFCDPHPYHHRVSGHQTTTVYNNTTIINNYGSGNNNNVINHGIDPNRIRAASKTEIRQVTLRDRPQTGTHAGRGERLERDGRTLVVSRPQLPPNPSPVQPVPGNNSVQPPLLTRPAREVVTRPSPVTPSNKQIVAPLTDTQPKTRGENPSARPPVLTPKTAAPANIVTSPRLREQISLPRDNSPALPGGSTTSPSKESAPPRSPVVIGKISGGQSQGGNPFKVFPTPTVPAPAPRTASPQPQPYVPPVVTTPTTTPKSPGSTHTWPSPTAQPSTRQDNIRIVRDAEARSRPQPTFTAPAPVQRAVTPPAPTAAPTPRISIPSPAISRPAPAPSPAPVITAPRAPSYTPPAPAPAPSPRSQASPPAAPRTDSGQRGRDKN